MRTLGLTSTEWKSYVDALSSTQERRIVLELQDLDGATLRSLTPVILDGQVSADTAGGEAMMVLTLQLLDPSRSLGFAPDSAAELPLHRKRAVKVWYNVRVPALGRWVECPVFEGPVWRVAREGAVVSLTAHSWERQALGAQWAARGFGKKSKKTSAIRALMAGVGETRMSVPDLPRTFPSRFVVKRVDAVWPKVRQVAASLNRNAFYDGSGRFVVRAASSKPSMTFDARWLLGEPKFDRSVDKLKNVFDVWGVKPKGSRTRPHEIVVATGDLSPSGLSRNGKPHRLVLREENNHIKTRKEARARAVRLRDAQTRGEAQVSIEVLPFPPLDLYDLVHFKSPEGTNAVRAMSFTLPLGGSASGGGQGSPMVIGQVRRTVASVRRRR
jgi:hypothetical protein